MKFSGSLLRTWGLVAASSWAAIAQAETTPPAPVQHSVEAELQARIQAREQMRQDIARQRADIEAREQAAEKACWQRFAVEDCLRQVRSQAREQDTVLREREVQLNDQARQEKAAQRLLEIERKQAEKQLPSPIQAHPRQPINAAGVLESERATAPKDAADIAAERIQRDAQAHERAAAQNQRQQSKQVQAAERMANEAERREKAQQKMQDNERKAQEHRASKTPVNAERKAAPLPIPEGVPKP